MCRQWFLIPGTNLWDTFGGMRVNFGQGRSVHTNRDLAQTMSVLALFAKQPFKIALKISDEFDGHQARFWEKFELEPVKVCERQGI